MKTLNRFLIIIMIMAVSVACGQKKSEEAKSEGVKSEKVKSEGVKPEDKAGGEIKPKEVMKSTTTKTYTLEKNGKTVTYRIKVYESRKNKVTLDKKDRNDIEQDRVITPDQVTKLIYIDNDSDPSYDRYIVLRYKKSANDSFELVPTKKGFGVKVDDKYVEYIIGEGVYYVNNKDRDFFYVDEFDPI